MKSFNKKRSFSVDDNRLGQTSMLEVEDMRKKFSEDMMDRRTRDGVIMQKMLRDMRRQSYSGGRVSRIVANNVPTL